MNGAEISLKVGNLYPYDDPQDSAPDEPDWTVKASRGVIADLQDRQDIKHGFEDVDCYIRAEIVVRLAEIIRLAYAAEQAKASAAAPTADVVTVVKINDDWRANSILHTSVDYARMLLQQENDLIFLEDVLKTAQTAGSKSLVKVIQARLNKVRKTQAKAVQE